MHYVVRNEQIRAHVQAAVRDIDVTLIDHPTEVLIRPYRARRSLEQNKLLHAIFSEISDKYAETRGRRFSPNAWKIFFKDEFLGSTPIALPDGSFKTAPVSTTSLSVARMTSFIEAILHYCADELSIYIETTQEDVA